MIEGTPLPPIRLRVVPGQYDDVLVAAPELDILGFSPTLEAFVFASAGVSLPRAECRNRTLLAREPYSAVSNLRSRTEMSIRPFDTC